MKFKDLLPGTVFTFHTFQGCDELVKLDDRRVRYVVDSEEDEVISVNDKVYPVIGQSYYTSIRSIAKGYADYYNLSQFQEDTYEIKLLNS